ncbi:MAG: hypothetical protein JSS14_02325 [Proteobacteria bacterium]|nr:hypothetical protein [Pseudomonadota bacterium]
MNYQDIDAMVGANPGYGNESLLRQQARLRDREADLKEQMRIAREQGAPRGQMVGSGQFQHFVAPHWTQQLSPLAAQIAIQAQKRALERDETGYDEIEMADVRKHMASMPPEDAPQAAKLQWAEKGSQIPALRSIMSDYAKDQLVNAPERQAQRDARKELASQAQSEKAAAQARELEYRRERDAQNDQLRRDLARDSNDLRATLAHAVRAASGDRASNYQIVQDAQGNASRVNKLTGEVTPLGSIGRQDSAITKKEQEAATSQGHAQDALNDISEAKKLLPKATGSGIGSMVDSLYRGVGSTNEGMKANRQLKVISGRLTASVPRFEGPQSDKDVQAYKEQAADIGNESLTTAERLDALKQVELMHRRVIQNAPRAKAAATGKSAPSIREAVEAAAKEKSVDELLNKYK